MRAQIKSFHSPDVDDLEGYTPEDSDNFCLLVELVVGPQDQEGGDIFSLQICTPKWLTSNFQIAEVIFTRHFVVVFSYDYSRIFSRIKNTIESCTGNNWSKIAEKVSRVAHWEFEDYQQNI